MSNVIVAYPSIKKSDFDWIQDIRRLNDRMYEVIAPHFTFIFPTQKLTIEKLVEHTVLKIEGQSKIPITLNSAILVEDDSKLFFHAFLVPSVGKQEIINLHDLLYTDELTSELRLDIPFIPHIGIGTNEDRAIMQKLVDEINSLQIHLKGSIDNLTIASFDGKQLQDIKQLPLRLF
jgi:hypothetical protein